MRYFEESHTTDNLHDSIEDAFLEWNLHDENRPVFIITDNAPEIVKAVTMNNKWKRIPCFAHTLQLAIKGAVTSCVRLRLQLHVEQYFESSTGQNWLLMGAVKYVQWKTKRSWRKHLFLEWVICQYDRGKHRRGDAEMSAEPMLCTTFACGAWCRSNDRSWRPNVGSHTERKSLLR